MRKKQVKSLEAPLKECSQVPDQLPALVNGREIIKLRGDVLNEKTKGSCTYGKDNLNKERLVIIILVFQGL